MRRAHQITACILLALGLGCGSGEFTPPGGGGDDAGSTDSNTGMDTSTQDVGDVDGTTPPDPPMPPEPPPPPPPPPPPEADAVIRTVNLRRLNQREYNNTIQDLLGTSERPGDNFPTDFLSRGFDTVGKNLGVSRAHLTVHRAATQRLVAETLADPSRRSRLLSCEPSGFEDECVGRAVAWFARKAWRRPASESELTALMSKVTLAQTEGDSLDVGLALAFESIFLAPQFLFRMERGEAPGERTLNSHELATRLSYFVWSTTPDATLSALADSGELLEDEVLRRETERLLDDPRSDALMRNFAEQWLDIRGLSERAFDPSTVAGFSPDLGEDMIREVELFFRESFDGSLRIDELLTSRHTYVSSRLAMHYEMPLPATEWERVSLEGTDRTGLLTMGATLASTSLAHRTSIVRRGNWARSRLLCRDTPPPPPGVEAELPEPSAEARTLRERTVLHRSDPSCLGCHSLIDGIGFALEHYDAIGRYREEDPEWGAIDDAGGTLELGDFAGAQELAATITANPAYADCVTDSLIVYALGYSSTGIAAPYKRWRTSLTEQVAMGNGTLRDLAIGLVQSDLFRSQLEMEAE